MKPRREHNWFLWISLPLGLAVLTFFFGGGGHTDYCPICHRQRNITEIEIPLVWLPIFWWTSESSTPLADWSMQHHPAGPHQHDWQYVAGSGGGAMCILGHGRQLYYTAIDPGTVDLLNAASRFEPTRVPELESLLSGANRSIDPARIRQALTYGGAVDRADYDAWFEFSYARLHQN